MTLGIESNFLARTPKTNKQTAKTTLKLAKEKVNLPHTVAQTCNSSYNLARACLKYKRLSYSLMVKHLRRICKALGSISNIINK